MLSLSFPDAFSRPGGAEAALYQQKGPGWGRRGQRSRGYKPYLNMSVERERWENVDPIDCGSFPHASSETVSANVDPGKVTKLPLDLFTRKSSSNTRFPTSERSARKRKRISKSVTATDRLKKPDCQVPKHSTVGLSNILGISRATAYLSKIILRVSVKLPTCRR